MNKGRFIFRIALISLFLLLNSGCDKTPYKPLYVQKFAGDDKLGEPYRMTEESFQIKINYLSEGCWYGSYHPWLDDTYRHILLVHKNGKPVLFKSESSFELEISKYGYEIVPSEPDFNFYTLRKIF